MAHERTSVKSLKVFWLGFLALMIVGVLAGCEKMATQSPDVSDSIRKSLDQAGLKDVSVSQDRDKGVVTLGGHVAADAGKSQAESDRRDASRRRKRCKGNELGSRYWHREEFGRRSHPKRAAKKRKI